MTATWGAVSVPRVRTVGGPRRTIRRRTTARAAFTAQRGRRSHGDSDRRIKRNRPCDCTRGRTGRRHSAARRAHNQRARGHRSRDRGSSRAGGGLPCGPLRRAVDRRERVRVRPTARRRAAAGRRVLVSDMSAIDAAWLGMDRPTNLAIITSALWFARPPDWEAVGELLRERLVDRFPRFSQRAVEPRIAIGMPRWEEDPRFDLRRHVHRHSLPAPGDQAALEVFVGTLQSTPLDRDKPLWSVHLVDGFGAGAAIVWRIHHCIVDGVSLARVLLSLSDHAPAAGIAPEAKRGTPPLSAAAGYAAPAMLAGRKLATSDRPRDALRGRAPGRDPPR